VQRVALLPAQAVDPCVTPTAPTTTTIDGGQSPVTPPTTAATAPSGGLPATGGGVPWSLIWVAVALLVPGAVIVVALSRRSDPTDLV
jgi:hypothetical protein